MGPTHSEREIRHERQRETGRQTEKETTRRQTDKYKDRHIGWQTDRLTVLFFPREYVDYLLNLLFKTSIFVAIFAKWGKSFLEICGKTILVSGCPPPVPPAANEETWTWKWIHYHIDSRGLYGGPHQGKGGRAIRRHWLNTHHRFLTGLFVLIFLNLP